MNNHIRKKIRNKFGSTALFLVMVIMSSFLLVTLTAADIVRNGLKMSGSQLDSAKAYYAAESGAEKIVWEIYKNDFSTSGCVSSEKIQFDDTPPDADCKTIDCCTVGGASYALSNAATYTISYDYNNVTGSTTLTCAGGFKDVERKIQIQY
jgi:hypothetical protein